MILELGITVLIVVALVAPAVRLGDWITDQIDRKLKD